MQAPYGTWRSPITAAMVAAQGVRLGAVAIDGDDIYWLEGRPAEGGRSVLVRRSADGRVQDVTPPELNVRTRVHEYGGGAYAVQDGVAYISNFTDQRLYRVPTRVAGAPKPITPAGKWFFADAVIDTARDRLVCVREDHSNPGAEPVNALVSIATKATEPNAGVVIASGYDFYSTPRLNADGSRLSWICWRHPQMPWDGTELWIAQVAADGQLENAVRIAGGDAESVYQPGWLPDGSVCFASDRDGWWRLYVWDAHNGTRPILSEAPPRTEFGRPEWVFGTATWASAGEDRLAAAFVRDGRWGLSVIDLHTRTLTEVPTALEPLDWLKATATHAVLVAASPTQAEAVVRLDLKTGRSEVLRGLPPAIDPAWVSVPKAIEFPTSDGQSAHAFYYPPCNPDYASSDAERPPVLVIGHGGPTTATRDTLDLRIQFWTSRGFAVADVNYRGSSGYGRAYRRRLDGQWGLADVADIVNVTKYLAGSGDADSNRLIVRGGSAGGYSTLAALTFHPDVFRAGASYYGICDLEVLARDTHKFESRYLDSLVGPYTAARGEYRARSPIHFVDRLACALILFQGLEDKVVPPNQSEMMADAVRRKGLPVTYLTFPGEQHGFRRAETISRCLEAELYFYGAVFGFAVAGVIDPPAIDNLEH